MLRPMTVGPGFERTPGSADRIETPRKMSSSAKEIHILSATERMKQVVMRNEHVHADGGPDSADS
jgi:hypothetical protein